MSVLSQLKQKQKENVLENAKQYVKQSSGYQVDERFYQMSKDSKGDSKVKIRFVPSLNVTKDDLVMFTTQKVHNINWFQDPLNEKSEKRFWTGVCPQSSGKDNYCPICDYGFKQGMAIPKLSGDENKNDPSQILRTKYFREFVNNDKIITNIMIVKDEINPDNEGKVFLYEVKSSIFKMFNDEFEKMDDRLSECSSLEERQARNIPAEFTAFDAFDLTMSKDMWLVYKAKANHPDKDPKHYWGSSRWDDIFTDKTAGRDDVWEDVVSRAHCLDEFTNSENNPTQEFLEEKLAHLTFTAVPEASKQGTVDAKPVKEETKVTPTPIITEPKVETISVEDILNEVSNPVETKVQSAPEVKEEVKEDKVETPKVSAPVDDMDALINSILNQ